MKLRNNAEQTNLATVGLGLTNDEARELMDALRTLLREPMSQQLVTGDNGLEIAVWMEE